MVGVRGCCWLGKVRMDMGATGLGVGRAEPFWPSSMPDAASGADDPSGEVCLRAGALLTLAGASTRPPHGC
jgi:hypothetical protein